MKSDQQRSDNLASSLTECIDQMTATPWIALGTVEAPCNVRILVKGHHANTTHDEMAMAWFDQLDKQFWYAPQGGIIYWTITHWMHVPDGELSGQALKTTEKKNEPS